MSSHKEEVRKHETSKTRDESGDNHYMSMSISRCNYFDRVTTRFVTIVYEEIRMAVRCSVHTSREKQYSHVMSLIISKSVKTVGHPQQGHSMAKPLHHRDSGMFPT